jgi:hypothetical protein
VDLPIKNGDLPIKNGDLPIRNIENGHLVRWFTHNGDVQQLRKRKNQRGCSNISTIKDYVAMGFFMW